MHDKIKIALHNLQSQSKSFKDLLDLLFPIHKDEASNENIANLSNEIFDFANAIIFYSNAKNDDKLESSKSGHSNLAFSLVSTHSHKRADLIRATRAINTAITSYNIIFFVSSTHLSIAFATRRDNKITSTKDVLEKITLIKDINLANPSHAHCKNLDQIAKIKPKEVDIYYSDILEALSISSLNKAFYTEIFAHFAHFVENLTLPNTSDEQTKRDFVLRLFSRILFCKFLEKKSIVDSAIWDTNLSQNYYHEVLEPLFFTTLNTPRESRNYGFLSEQIISLLHAIPYLNGGLFSPQDNDFFDLQNPNAHINSLHISNDLFSELFATLNRYHFTIDEADESAVEVALDPELLGQIFESLLSQLFTDNKLEKLDKNSLRKATGSYYTPREIVRYMVKSAILLHLQTKLKGKVDSQFLESLVFGNIPTPKSPPQGRGLEFDSPSLACGNSESSPSLAEGARGWVNSKDSILILQELSTLKILDPACGSGAFPMGILNEIIRIQSDLDDTRPLYTRKLEILQECIYGIDIQPMATEIVRLRCFLSLIIDENPSDIKPLPNLEFKFISANALLPLQTSLQDSRGRQLGSDIYEKGLIELQQIRAETFTSHDKIALQSKYKATIDKIAKDLFFEAQGETPLTKWNPFNPNDIAQFFDSAYMFGVESFDIVIGNPPYISSENMPQAIKDNRYIFKTAHKKTDIYVFFYEIGLKLLKQNGIITYITSNKFLSQEYGLKLRELFLQNTIQSIVNFNINVFDNATVDTCVLLLQKCETQNNEILIKNIISKKQWRGFENIGFDRLKQDIFKDLEFYNFRLTLNNEKLALLQKISSHSLPLNDICFVSYGCRPCGNAKNPNLTKKDLVHSTPQGNAKPYIEAKDNYLTRYTIHSHDFLDYQKDKIYNAMFEELFSATKLMAGAMLGDIKLINFVYDDKGRFCNHSMCCSVLWKDMQKANHPSPKKQITKEKITTSMKYDLKFLQGVLNSSLIKFYVKELLHDGLHFYPEHQKQLPIPNLDSKEKQTIADEIVNLVNKILESKAQDSTTQPCHTEAFAEVSQNINNKDISLNAQYDKRKKLQNDKIINDLESQINDLVYQLYDLDSHEIQIIEN
ncbi:Eco57I restriction-modification methylase domain-containing protein [Helicobacter cinaedi]|uniref:Eco57I restriction-modification methylase domain-containing protein n=1 Tax=Helicobacter cinaedi TaxID=213 RepID=UPI000DA1A16F|nr:N-6 DNA methylase [Helicobacter cinaedi]